VISSFDPLGALFFAVSVVPAMVIHELAHGWMAIRFGDHSPRFADRMTLNPVPHIDPFGSIVLPGLLLLPVLFGRPGFAFGYAKPMPVNRATLPNPDRQVVWIALVGIVANLVLALAGALAYRFLAPLGPDVVDRFLRIWVFTNVLMAIVHVMPVPPLDGSRMLAPFLPGRARTLYESWEPYGGLFMLAVFFILPGPFLAIVGAVVEGLFGLLLGGAGVG
jgi:Zn-dependent protease